MGYLSSIIGDDVRERTRPAFPFQPATVAVVMSSFSRGGCVIFFLEGQKKIKMNRHAAFVARDENSMLSERMRDKTSVCAREKKLMACWK
mmetsp:Transcript_5822/g.11555  ORF Transcript_5822/g.11555 Transcript_5822/m.11555 type:complete len:90 (-) Transcript_5822:268-537(-)